MTERSKTVKKFIKSDNPGLRDAVRAKRLPARPPTEGDRPPPQPFPGPKRKPLPGQIKIEEASDDAA
jgi:hypothetical protein